MKAFATMTATMNLIAIACFFEAIYYSIFEYLLAANSKNRGFFDLVSTYFAIVEINGQKILYLHYLI